MRSTLTKKSAPARASSKCGRESSTKARQSRTTSTSVCCGCWSAMVSALLRRWGRSRGTEAAPTFAGSQPFGQPFGQALQRGRAIHRVEVHVEQAETFLVAFGDKKRLIELLLGFHHKTPAGAQHFGDATVIPCEQIVVWAVLDVALRAVAAIVQHDDNRVQSVAHGGGEFHAGHLERAVADQHQRTRFWLGHLDADAGGHSESHRRV